MEAKMEAKSAAVLVVGGSLVGLSTAVFLAWRGVPTVLVEKYPGSSLHPRAIGYTARTMELFAAVGIAEQFPQIPASFRLTRATVDSLAGTWRRESEWSEPAADKPKMTYTPYSGSAIAQDKVEGILRKRAEKLGVQLLYNHTLVHFTQDASDVTATVHNHVTATTTTLRTQYMVAADGHRSFVRRTLGIGLSGRGHMRTVRSVLFRAPLDQYLASGVSQFNIEQPHFKAFLTTYQDGRWVLMFFDDQERDNTTLHALIHRAIGRTDVPVEIITTGRWELGAVVADRFSQGRVFIAGDAAHTLPPSRGGYGANTGIEDAHNLAWKLANVLSGAATPSLLDTYDAERRPIAWLRHDQTFAHEDYAADANGNGATQVIDDDAMELGQLVRSSAVVGASATLPPAQRPDQWAGQPGTRAPHVPVIKDGASLSTLDLFQRGWVLLAAHDLWKDAAMQAAHACGLPLQCVHVGVDVQSQDHAAFAGAFGWQQDGATLVRPDGYIAWRAPALPANAAGVLTSALKAVLGQAAVST